MLKENVLASEKSEKPQNVRCTSDNVILYITAYFVLVLTEMRLLCSYFSCYLHEIENLLNYGSGLLKKGSCFISIKYNCKNRSEIEGCARKGVKQSEIQTKILES